jgi:protein-L-isoaspartate(D-aspartate) O-methyltransferase
MRRVSQFLILAVLAASGCGQKPAPVVDLASERQHMVQEQLMPRGIHEERVLAAMAKVPREEFVPQGVRFAAHTDQPLPIGYSQTNSQPSVVAFITEQLQ